MLLADQSRFDLRKQILYGATIGFVYGLAMRIGIYRNKFPSWLGVMSVAFVLAVPFVMGFVTVFVAERRESMAGWYWVVLPWIPLFGALAAAGVLLIEGLICIAMFAPIGMGCASLGGIMGGFLGRVARGRRSSDMIAGCVLFLPLLVAPLEQQVLYSREIHETKTYIDISAPADVVWSNIERVPKIDKSELPISWSHRIGFPDPVEATLSYEGVGAVRHATFAGAVLFIENVDVWEPQKRLAFSIHAQTDQIPNTTLDEHVRIGGPFFDVLRGEYEMESLPGGVIRLHLSSRHRESTTFNWYARLWADAVMADLQKRILYVVKARCERR
jgi:hypothetical protein